jgi:penicillin-binding protein 1C
VLKPLLYAAMLDNGTALPAMLFPDVPTYYRK